jgi:putrescine aminotransferase
MAALSALQEADRKHQLHPFTNHAELHEAGTHLIVDAEGCHFVDSHGRRILDGLAGLWCVNVGYNCAAIVRAVTEQMERLPYYPSFFNSTTEPPIHVAEFLAKRAPEGIERTIFSNSGSEANETALKIIRAYWKLKGQPARKKIVTRTFAYHGVTLATTSMTGLPNCQIPFDLPLEGFVHVPGPYAYGARTDLTPEAYGEWCLGETRAVIEREGPETVAAMFVEPVQGAGGVIVPPEGYLKKLRDLCSEFGILFVADEVITAFGRLGDWFASGLWDLRPDLITLAKGLTSGYLPLGATMMTHEIGDMMLSGGYFAHGYTYTGHPTSAAAALANLQVIDSLGLVGRVRDDVGPAFRARLAEFAGHPAVSEVRGTGLIGALELVPRGGRDALTPSTLLGFKASNIIREEGAMVRGIRDLIAMAPPLIITHNELDELFGAVRRGLDRLWASGA